MVDQILAERLVNQGDQTEVTKEIENFASKIENSDDVRVLTGNIFETYDKAGFRFGTSELSAKNGPDFSRNASQILAGALKGEIVNGCNEAGVLLASLLKAKGVKLQIIQALEKNALIRYEDEGRRIAHVYIEITQEDKLIVVDSVTGKITDKLPENMVEGSRGNSFWEMGLNGSSEKGEGRNQLDQLFRKALERKRAESKEKGV